jgi:2-iminobutanoate/2-iminopropanoate deaminase
MTTHRFYDPAAIAAPGPTYHHAVEIPAGARVIHVSGQIGQKKDGSVPATIEEQSEVVWGNIQAILADAGMDVSNLVKITSYVTKHENFAKYAAVRAKYLGTNRPASTGLVVSALVRPEWLIEVEAVAAK